MSGKPVDEVAAEFVRAYLPTSNIQRGATVEEVPSLRVYVASTQAFATMGAALRVDGGVVATIGRRRTRSNRTIERGACAIPPAASWRRR